jgi:hypothetical protein
VEGHEERADELEREAKAMGRESERLEDDVRQAKSDWDAKKGDSQVPGALDESEAGDFEGDSDEDDGEGEPDEEDAAGDGDGGSA